MHKRNENDTTSFLQNKNTLVLQANTFSQANSIFFFSFYFFFINTKHRCKGEGGGGGVWGGVSPPQCERMPHNELF